MQRLKEETRDLRQELRVRETKGVVTGTVANGSASSANRTPPDPATAPESMDLSSSAPHSAFFNHNATPIAHNGFRGAFLLYFGIRW